MTTSINIGSIRTHNFIYETSWQACAPTTKPASYVGNGTSGDLAILAATYRWTNFDSLLSAWTANGWTINLMIWATPAWATTSTTVGSFGLTGEAGLPSNMQYLKDHVTLICRRIVANGYNVKYMEILNEPNLTAYWAGTMAQAADYFIKAAQVIAAERPSTIVIPPSFYDVTYLNSFLSQVSSPRGMSYITCINLHWYTYFPNQSYGGNDEQFNSNLGIINARIFLASYSLQNTDIYITEFGLSPQTTDPLVTWFAAQTDDFKRKYICRIFLAAARCGVKNIWVFNNGTLLGDYTSVAGPCWQGIHDAKNLIGSSTTVTSAGVYADGREWLVFSDGKRIEY